MLIGMFKGSVGYNSFQRITKIDPRHFTQERTCPRPRILEVELSVETLKQIDPATAALSEWRRSLLLKS